MDFYQFYHITFNTQKTMLIFLTSLFGSYFSKTVSLLNYLKLYLGFFFLVHQIIYSETRPQRTKNLLIRIVQKYTDNFFLGM